MTPPQTTGQIDVISDAICPWCYIGKRQLERALSALQQDELSFAVGWRAFQLNPDAPPGGYDRAEYRLAKFGARAAELDAQITDAAAAVGLAFRMDLIRRTPNTVDAHRVIRMAGLAGVQDAVAEALFAGYFTEGADIGDHATLVSLASGAGLEASAVSAMLAAGDGRYEVLEDDAGARRAGLSGVPTFVMQGHVLFSGAVPAEAMAEAFGKAWRILSTRAA